jgi:hypothetical protein
VDRQPWPLGGVAGGASAAVVTVVAVLAAAGIGTTMVLAGPHGVAVVIIALLVAVQVGLLLAVRRGLTRARQFLLAWSGEAGLSFLVAGDPTVASALVYLGVGLVFALVVVAGLALTRSWGEPAPQQRHDDTQPLPVPDGD